MAADRFDDQSDIKAWRRGRARHSVRVVVLAACIAVCGTTFAGQASADPGAAAPTVQNHTINDAFDIDGGGVIHLGVLGAGADVPAGGELSFTAETCTPADHQTVVIQADGTVTVNNRVPVDVTCTFHGTDSNGTQSNEATLHVLVPSPGLPHIQDQSRDLLVGQGGGSFLILQGLLAAGAADPVGRGLTFAASGCTPSPQTAVFVQADGTVSVNLLQPIDLTCSVRARDAAQQPSNVATLHIRVHAGQPPSVQDQAITQAPDTDKVWDGVLSQGAVNPAGGSLSYTVGLAPAGQQAGCRYNGGPDRGLVSQPTSGVDHFRVNLVGSDFSGTIVCSYAGQDVGNRLAFGTLTITVPALTPTTTTITPAVASLGVNERATFVAAIASASEATPTGTVTFLVDGLPFGAPVGVDPSGHASIAAIFGSGVHSVVARYDGDTQHEGSTSVPSSVGVRCDTVITGRRSAVLLPRSGTVCLVNATITGTMIVPTGLTLDVENSSISGPLLLARLVGVRICGSHLANVAVVSSTGFALLGDPAHRCAANTVSGALIATANTHGLVVVDNQVGGLLQTAGNSGAGPLPDERSPVVTGNHR